MTYSRKEMESSIIKAFGLDEDFFEGTCRSNQGSIYDQYQTYLDKMLSKDILLKDQRALDFSNIERKAAKHREFAMNYDMSSAKPMNHRQASSSFLGLGIYETSHLEFESPSDYHKYISEYLEGAVEPICKEPIQKSLGSHCMEKYKDLLFTTRQERVFVRCSEPAVSFRKSRISHSVIFHLSYSNYI